MRHLDRSGCERHETRPRTFSPCVGLIVLLTAFTACTTPGSRPDADESVPSLPQILVITKTTGFRHASIPAAAAAIGELAANEGIRAVVTDSTTTLEEISLTRYRGVVFLLTSGEILTERQRSQLESFVRSGGRFAGVHSASDTEYTWPFYEELIGTRFSDHPSGVHRALLHVVDFDNPLTSALPSPWERTDEWYDFESSPDARILIKIDESTYPGGSMGEEHPIAWCKRVDDGVSWYTAGGHTPESYSEPLFRRHLAGGLRLLAGIENAPCIP